jgi:hypothetical protein
MAGMDLGQDMGVAQTLIQNLPQYKPDDLSGWIAAMQGGGGQGPGFQPQQQYGGFAPMQGSLQGMQGIPNNGASGPSSVQYTDYLRTPLMGQGQQQPFDLGQLHTRGQTLDYGNAPSGAAGFGFSGMGVNAGNGMTTQGSAWNDGSRSIYGNSGAQNPGAPRQSQYGTMSGFGGSQNSRPNPYPAMGAMQPANQGSFGGYQDGFSSPQQQLYEQLYGMYA